MALEDRIFWDCSIPEEHAKVLDDYHNTNNFWLRMRVDGHIGGAYFGMNKSRQNLVMGLNVQVIPHSPDAAETITYSRPDDIRDFMQAFGARTTEELIGRDVTAYANEFFQLAGLSARK